MRLRNIGAGVLRARAAAEAHLPAGYVLWLDVLTSGALWADTGRSTPASVGGSVASWYDGSTGYAATQATATARPTRQSGGLQFRNQRLVGPPPFTATADCTLLMVASMDAAATGTAAIPLSIYASTRPIVQMFYRSDAANGRWSYWQSENLLIGAGNLSYAFSFSLSTMYCWGFRSGPAPATSGGVTAARSGLANVTGDRTGPPQFSNQSLVLGALEPGGAAPASCTMRAIVAYSRALTNTELGAAMAFFAARHGI